MKIVHSQDGHKHTRTGRFFCTIISSATQTNSSLGNLYHQPVVHIQAIDGHGYENYKQFKLLL